MTMYRAGWLTVCTAALLIGVGAAIHASPASLLDPRVAWLGLFVLLSSPSAVRIYGRGLRSFPTPSAAHLDAFARAFARADVGYVGVPPPPDPRALTDEELCQRWRASCLYLRRRPSPTEVMLEVEQRQIDLDEFERRHPGGYAAWLASDAGDLDDLTPYVRGGRVGDATINWDELTLGRD